MNTLPRISFWITACEDDIVFDIISFDCTSPKFNTLMFVCFLHRWRFWRVVTTHLKLVVRADICRFIDHPEIGRASIKQGFEFLWWVSHLDFSHPARVIETFHIWFYCSNLTFSSTILLFLAPSDVVGCFLGSASCFHQWLKFHPSMPCCLSEVNRLPIGVDISVQLRQSCSLLS